MVCDCGFIAKNQGSLASHKRGCVVEKNKIKPINEPVSVVLSNNTIIPPVKKKKVVTE